MIGWASPAIDTSNMSHSMHGSGGGELFPIPGDPYFAKIYWMFVGGAIGVGVLVHLGELLLYRQRLVDALFLSNLPWLT